MTDPAIIADPMFWRQPMATRMETFAELREIGPFLPIEFTNPWGRTGAFHAVTRYDEIVEISRRPQDFCSGKGAVSVMGQNRQEGFSGLGMFINMDDPRHAHQRGIVAKKFTPRHLAGLLESVETIATELIDAMCEKGEVDLVEAISQPFPLLIICDMMGIPRSELDTMLTASNAILGAGDPDMIGNLEDPNVMLQAGMHLIQVINEIADDRRKNPRDDLTSMLVHTDVGEETLTPAEFVGFFILLAVAGNDTTRNAISHGVHLLTQHPEQRAIWQDDIEGVTSSAVEEIVRYAAPVTFMRRTVTRDGVTVSGHEFSEDERVILFYGVGNRDPREFENPEVFDVRRDPNPHIGFGGPGPHFCLGAHLARRELAVMFRQLLTRLPDIHVTEEPTPLAADGIPLVQGLKRVPVKFTPTAPVGTA